MKKQNLKSEEQKALLLKVMGQIISEKRKELGKGILLLSYEYDISNSSITQFEKGKRDVQITTLWKLVNALNMTFPEFINEVEKRLPPNFKIIEE
jgi:transcriptional regulator with XRE-family HTH domain